MPADETTALREAVREELVLLWDDLHEARSYAINGEWSIRCDSLVDRIKTLTPLLGPTPWGEIQIRLIEDGIYQRVNAEMGIEVAPDMAKIAELRAYMDAQSRNIRSKAQAVQ